MKHEIDLKNYSVRTDLILEQIEGNSDIQKKETKHGNVIVTSITLQKDNEELRKKKGNYITISFKDVTDITNHKTVEDIFSKELKKLIKASNLVNKKALIIGLGNDNSTPDALGPKVIENIIVTRHLFEIPSIDVEKGYTNVSAIIPGVMGNTGVESYEIISGVIKETSPDYLIVIDALASSSIKNLNKTIQITDTGISPGSGIGNKRHEISKDSIGIPVIAIGVPTVVDAATIVSDTIYYLIRKFSYSKKNINNPVNKLKHDNNINYMNEDPGDLSKEDRNKILGFIGNLSDEEFKQLIYEVLTPIGYNLMVTPKEIDFLIDKIAILLSNGINKVLHNPKSVSNIT